MTAPATVPEATAMRMPRFRFTVRGMMVAVAAVAAILVASRRSAGFYRRAEREGHVAVNSGNVKGPRGKERGAYHEALKAK